MPETVANSLVVPSYLKRKIVIALVVIIVFIITIEIWVANRSSTFGEQINALEQRKYSLGLENDNLKNQIAQKKSLTANQKKAEFLGFNKIKDIQYIKNQVVALNPNKF